MNQGTNLGSQIGQMDNFLPRWLRYWELCCCSCHSACSGRSRQPKPFTTTIPGAETGVYADSRKSGTGVTVTTYRDDLGLR